MNDRITFGEIVKDKFMDVSKNFQLVSMDKIVITLLIGLIVSVFIFMVYRMTFKGVVYSVSFNISLTLMCLITAIVILTISSNVVLSLGMVGALSIVRFRTAVKDPMDIVYMFWSISAGIIVGAGLYSLAITGTIFVGLVLIVFSKLKLTSTEYVLVVRYSASAEEDVRHKLSFLRARLKSTSVSSGNIELTVELKLKNDDAGFVKEFASIEGVKDAVLVRFNGEYSSYD